VGDESPIFLLPVCGRNVRVPDGSCGRDVRAPSYAASVSVANLAACVKLQHQELILGTLRYGMGLPESRLPITALIQRRFSCRTYAPAPIPEAQRQALAEFCAAQTHGPLGNALRFVLLAATEEERESLRGLGTYGFIRHPAGFIVGAVRRGTGDLEDFGYVLERIVLEATALELGTCWLGGSFTRSSFAARIGLQADELLPAVVATGLVADRRFWLDRLVRAAARGDQRLPWEQLFFDGDFIRPLTPQTAGVYAQALEMVRLGPSASNKQPWRIVRRDEAWHFYLQRTPGYPPRAAEFLVERDLQRVDMGIAMAHFALTLTESGHRGDWVQCDPGLTLPPLTEYRVTWQP